MNRSTDGSSGGPGYNRRTLTPLNPPSNPAPRVRVAAAAAVLVVLALALPVQLPSAGGGSSSEECLTIADRPVTGADAIPRLEQCATIVPDDVELLADLGAAYETAGRSGDAERIYGQIVTLDDDYADIHVRLARLLLQRRDTVAARAPSRARPADSAESPVDRRADRAGGGRRQPMIGRLLFYAGRFTAAAIFLITWGYGVTTYSPFAFDMFVRPRLLPELVTFVNWHHVFYWIAFTASALTFIPDLRSPRRGAAWWAAVGYVVVFAAVGVHVLGATYLATLTGQSRSLAVVPGALLPLVWLAVIDHLAGGVPSPANRSIAPPVSGRCSPPA